MNSFYGINIITSEYAVKKSQDWSLCRSKARAKRRHAKGIKTRMVEKEQPTCYFLNKQHLIIAHPLLKDAIISSLP